MANFLIDALGKPSIPSPIRLDWETPFFKTGEKILVDPFVGANGELAGDAAESFELAGPREQIFFDAKHSKAAIVSCGGLCPGINAVIRGLVMQLWYRYGVRQIIGFKYGYHGFDPANWDQIRPLNPENVELIHEQGGSILGNSRGTPETSVIVDALVHHGINMVFPIGGDGTMRGALAIATEVARRGLNISVVGIPKTIDNDIPYVRRSFGFETAVSIACSTIRSAHDEATGTRNGIGLVKLMGRHSGYIAANATMASGHVNICIVPEVGFSLEGPNGLLALIEKRLNKSRHIMIVVAEGAGQNYFNRDELEVDPSGNRKLGDVGILIKQRINEHFRDKDGRFPVRYIDPSYLIRSAPAIPSDVVFCTNFAQNAVHAAMAGKTSLLIGYWHGKMTHVPLAAVTQAGRQTISPQGELWYNILESTGQPQTIGS